MIKINYLVMKVLTIYTSIIQSCNHTTCLEIKNRIGINMKLKTHNAQKNIEPSHRSL